MRNALLAAAILLLARCAAPEQESSTGPIGIAKPADPPAGLINLLDGAVVINRSGEAHLAQSALNAIDATASSVWSSPPGNPQQDMTIILPARTRLRRVGISTGISAQGGQPVSKVAFETSIDGHRFEPLQTVSMTKPADLQLFDAKPVEAVAVRVKVLETLRKYSGSDLAEVLLDGEELEPAQRGPLGGTWRINNYTARLGENGSRVFGSVDMDPPMLIEGAWDGRVAKFVWVRRKQYGVGLLAVDRTGQHLSGFWWFHEAIPPYLGTAWFGRKVSPGAAPEPQLEVAETSLRDRNSVPLYGLRFDSTNQIAADTAWALEQVRRLLVQNPDKQFRIVANEVRSATAEEDQRIAEQQIASVRAAIAAHRIDTDRLAFAAAGRRYRRDPGGMPLYAHLHSRIEMEVIEK